MMYSEKYFQGCDEVTLNAGDGCVEAGEEERKEVNRVEKWW